MHVPNIFSLPFSSFTSAGSVTVTSFIVTNIGIKYVFIVKCNTLVLPLRFDFRLGS